MLGLQGRAADGQSVGDRGEPVALSVAAGAAGARGCERFLRRGDQPGRRGAGRGARFYGTRYFCDPRGADGCRGFGSEDEVLVADLDLGMVDEVRTLWQFFRDRRPETYGWLAELRP